VSAGPDARSLDNPVRSSLLGPHARFAQRHGGVLRYLPPVSPFAALPDQPGDRDWADAAALAGPGGLVPLAGVTMPPPPGWKAVLSIPCVQMLDAGVAAAPDDEAARLGAPDVPQMLGLVARTEPGPFLHVAASNVNAIRLYESLGFRFRRHVLFSAARAPLTRPAR
jgi:hypothetical protein